MWRGKWTDIITLFDFPAPIRKAIYTTNAIESGQQRDSQVHAEPQDLPQRRVGLEDRLHGDSRGIHASGRCRSTTGKQALNHFAILYEGRMPQLTSK